MNLTVREMTLPESAMVIDYFHGAPPEHLETLGVDPTRLPPREAWAERLEREFGKPIERRSVFFLVWLLDDAPVGFSSCDKIVYGERANMHLHVIDAARRARGIGAECVHQGVRIYFDRLRLARLFCEPNAFNVAPNRTLQRAGFKYVKTHRTVPGPLNYHQAVNRWMIEAPLADSAAA